uniref:Uncharacterized protein n=1 Tax=Megaselia scalaris TaxID=36166 RepID=T1H3J3_MEGSC
MYLVFNFNLHFYFAPSYPVQLDLLPNKILGL